jgi:uncharacterized protein (TIGR02391 family)
LRFATEYANRVSQVFDWLKSVGSRPNCTAIPVHPDDITAIKNELIRISVDISKEHPFFSNELFTLKDQLFIGYGTINPWVFGQIVEILKALQNNTNTEQYNPWSLIHPQIARVSKQLYLNGHYSNAAEDAFDEINDRVKRLYALSKPGESIPDRTKVMTTVFSDNNPMIEFCRRMDDTGHNTQLGYMNMLSGAMSALRNPKAHANITITAEDAMRRLMFASMLMYKIDEAVKHSEITE